MLEVSELFVYPIKSLGGISVSSARVEERGFQFDRRWMLTDDMNQFISQRELPDLALLQVQIMPDGLNVTHKQNHSSVRIPFWPETDHLINVSIWDDICEAQRVSPLLDQWFSDILSFSCRLVYMPDRTKRKVDPEYAVQDEITGFSDGYPFLMIGKSSLEDLNERLEIPVEINRFRPNIVFTGGQPYAEDNFEEFTINGIVFAGVKLCARCMITTIDQDNAIKAKEPLRTLSTYREKNGNVYFGQNLLHQGSGMIRTGDTIEVKKRKLPAIPT